MKLSRHCRSEETTSECQVCQHRLHDPTALVFGSTENVSSFNFQVNTGHVWLHSHARPCSVSSRGLPWHLSLSVGVETKSSLSNEPLYATRIRFLVCSWWGRVMENDSQ